MSWFTGIFTATYRYYQKHLLSVVGPDPSLLDTGITIEMNFTNPKANIGLNFYNPMGNIEIDFTNPKSNIVLDFPLLVDVTTL